MVKSNYGLYVQELEGLEIIESNRGFATYRIKDEEKELWVHDVFVRPDYRGCGIAKRYFDELVELAKENGCKSIKTYTNKLNNGWEKSTAMLQKYGFSVNIELQDGTVYLIMEI